MANNSDYLSYEGLVQLKTETDKRYLRKTTYEYNKEISFGSSGYLKIGSFSMYDSNITIDIDATTSTTYHGTIVIATQNVSESSIGSAHIVSVYGDPSGTITSAIRVVWTNGSRNYDVYFVPQAWSKNLVHIRAMGLYATPTDVCVAQEGTAPTTTSGLEPTNVLTNTFVPKTRTINSKALSSDITLSASDVGALPSDTSYVSSVNGSTGAITNVAKTNADNSFSTKQTFNNGIYTSSIDSGESVLTLGGSTGISVVPYADDSLYLGANNKRWKRLYLSGDIRTGDGNNATIIGINEIGKVKSVNNTSPDANGNVSLTIPTKTSDLTNDSGFITSSYHDSTKQDTLVSGTNIKTINGNSVLGSGDLVISGGGGDATWDFHAGTGWEDCYSVASPNADDVNGYSIQIGGDGFTLDTGDINNNSWSGSNVFYVNNNHIDASHNGTRYFYADYYGSLTIDSEDLGMTIFSVGNGWLYMYDDNLGERGIDVNSSTFQWYGYDVLTSKNINGGGLTYNTSTKLLAHSNSVSAGTIGSTSATTGSSISIPYATYDANGHITGKGTHTHTLNAVSPLFSTTTSTTKSATSGTYILIPYATNQNQTYARIGVSSTNTTTFYGLAYAYIKASSTTTGTTYIYLQYFSSANSGWTSKTISFTGYTFYFETCRMIRIG